MYYAFLSAILPCYDLLEGCKGRLCRRAKDYWHERRTCVTLHTETRDIEGGRVEQANTGTHNDAKGQKSKPPEAKATEGGSKTDWQVRVAAFARHIFIPSRDRPQAGTAFGRPVKVCLVVFRTHRKRKIMNRKQSLGSSKSRGLDRFLQGPVGRNRSSGMGLPQNCGI